MLGGTEKCGGFHVFRTPFSLTCVVPVPSVGENSPKRSDSEPSDGNSGRKSSESQLRVLIGSSWSVSQNSATRYFSMEKVLVKTVSCSNRFYEQILLKHGMMST